MEKPGRERPNEWKMQMKTVFMFPGQSSRYPQMFEKLVAMDPENGALLAQASEIVGRDLAAHYDASRGKEMFQSNCDVQLAVFIANHMFLTMLQRRGIDAELSLGLSLGEWNHLVHIGALGFEQALPAIEQRGHAYDAGPRGGMASFFPVDIDELAPLVEKASALGTLEIVNLNSPRQHVVAGEWEALEEALRLVSDELYVDGVVIEKQVPMHASMFAPVSERFRQVLQTLPFAAPRLPYMPNRLATPMATPTHEDFVELLSTHVSHPVLWRASIDALLAQEEELVMVEVGPKAVLYNLFDRKWHKGIQKMRTDSKEDTASHFAQMVEELVALRAPAPLTVAAPPATNQTGVGAPH